MDDTTAAVKVSHDGRLWTAKAQDWLVERRANIVVETTARNVEHFRQMSARFRQDGYATEVVAMAVPEGLSRLGILSRYAEQLRSTGHGRYTPVENHDASYQGVRAALGAVEDDRLVDVISVWRRGGQVLYANQLTAKGTWAVPIRALEVLDTERARILTYPEATAALHELQRASRTVGDRLDAEPQRVDETLEAVLPEGAQAVATAAVMYPRVLTPLARDPLPGHDPHSEPRSGPSPDLDRDQRPRPRR